MSDDVPAPFGAYGSVCFLCHRQLLPRGRDGVPLSGVDAVMPSDEDVVPKWLMRMYSIGDAAAVMPNGQLSGYGQRKVPCCRECNQRMSIHLEKPMRAAMAAGVDAVRAMDPTTMFMWLAKIYYGTRFFETRFRSDVADPVSPMMLDHAELLGRNDYLRRLLLTVPRNLTLLSPPASVLVFQAGVPENEQTRFDFFVSSFDDVDLISVRIGDSFIVSIFGDNGYWAHAFGGIRIIEHALAEMTLHPTQCTEISLWLASEAAAHEKGGSWDLVTTTHNDGTATAAAPPGTVGKPIPGHGSSTLFTSRFTVTPNGAPPEMIRLLRVNSFLSRLGYSLTLEEVQRAKVGSYGPTTLINSKMDEPVQASCYDLSCPDLFRRAGWLTSLPPCSYCGAEGEPLSADSAD